MFFFILLDHLQFLFFEKNIFEYCVLVSVVTFISSVYVFFVLPYLFKDFFNEDEWTIGKNFIFIFIGIFLTGTILWFFADYYKAKNNIENVSYPVFIVYNFLVALFPVSIVIVFNEKKIRLKREKRAEEINNLKKSLLVSEKEVVIFADNNKESIVFTINSLVYITSQGNYASFFLMKNGDLKEQILRVTLSKVSKELQNYPNFIRCHKSYFINKNYIQKISGNARGYLIHSDVIPFQIPVSRNFSKESFDGFLK